MPSRGRGHGRGCFRSENPADSIQEDEELGENGYVIVGSTANEAPAIPIHGQRR
jgi:hypothetical protein